MAINKKTFKSSGSWLCPAGVTNVILWGHGGGGGGGAGQYSGSNNESVGGGGAGYGYYNVSVVPNTTYTITIGAGGLGGTSSLDDGTNGGDTTFGALHTFPGAAGGDAGQAGSPNQSNGTTGGGVSSSGIDGSDSNTGYDGGVDGASSTDGGGGGGAGGFGDGGSGGTTATNGTDAPTTTIPTSFGSYTFDGTNDYIETPIDTETAGWTGLTLAAWVKPGPVNSGGGIFGKDSATGTTDRQFYLTTQGTKYRLLLSDDGSAIDFTDSVTTIVQGVWVHVAATWDGTNMKIYINGVLDKTTANVSATSALSTESPAVEIGRKTFSGSSAYYEGDIADARVYSEALDVTALLALVTSATEPDDTNLEAHYKFFGDGNMKDSSLNDLDAINHGATYSGSLPTILATEEDSNTGAGGGGGGNNGAGNGGDGGNGGAGRLSVIWFE